MRIALTTPDCRRRSGEHERMRKDCMRSGSRTASVMLFAIALGPLAFSSPLKSKLLPLVPAKLSKLCRASRTATTRTFPAD